MDKVLLRRCLVGYLAALFGIVPVALPLWTRFLRDSVGRFITIGQIHFAQYLGVGILAALYAQSLASRQTRWFLLAGILLTGLLEEGFQSLFPQRFFQWSDVALNGTAGLLGFWAVTAFRPLLRAGRG